MAPQTPNPDILSLIQSHYTILHQQIFSTISYLSQRHPLSPPSSDPYSRSLTLPGREDSDPSQTSHPLHPVSRETFEESQKQLSEDLVRKVQQIQGLVSRLPGGERGEEQQEAEVKRLAEELRNIEKDRKESRRQMRQLARRLEDVIGGMSTNIDINASSETNGHG